MQREDCLDCGCPLILRKNDDPNDPVHEEQEYEDGEELCGNCQIGDSISQLARNSITKD
jgi:hypothetical protein